MEMRAIEVGIRELQRATSSFMGRVEEGLHLIVTRHGRPIGFVLPLDLAPGWVMLNRPLRQLEKVDDVLERDGDGERWLVDGVVWLAPAAAIAYDALGHQARERLLHRLGVLRNIDAYGRIAVRVGAVWALLDFDGGAGRTVSILGLARRHELDRWVWAGEPMSLRAGVAVARGDVPSRSFSYED